MGKRKTTEQFKEEVYERVGNEYEVLDEYVNANSKLAMKHAVCGFIYPVAPNKFLQGRRCPKCHCGYTMTTEDFKQRVYDLTDNAYQVLGEYTLIENPIEVKHECGHIWDVNPKHFLAGSRCPLCAGNLKVTIQQFQQEVLNLVGEEYQIIGEYINTDTPVKMVHKVCNHTIKIARAKFLAGNRCRYCAFKKNSDKQRKTTEQFQQELQALANGQFEVISDYRGAYEQIDIKHNECGQTFTLSAARNILMHPFCRKCSGKKESRGESLLKNELDQRNWQFKKEYRFQDCRDLYPLPFDFAVFSAEQLAFLIEYDGQPHYHPVEIYGGKERFLDCQKKDRIKNEYCQQKKIPLLRIPYFDKRKVGDIIDQFIVANNLCIKSE